MQRVRRGRLGVPSGDPDAHHSREQQFCPGVCGWRPRPGAPRRLLVPSVGHGRVPGSRGFWQKTVLTEGSPPPLLWKVRTPLWQHPRTEASLPPGTPSLSPRWG